MNELCSLFLLDPQIHFLNHGSFGACPRPVFETYQAWQRRLESQPVLLLGRQFAGLMAFARQQLGDYLGAAADDLVYIPNATYGVNLVARSLALTPGDEILTSNHEYGACDNAWEFVCRQAGARYLHQPLDLPIVSVSDCVEQFWQGVTGRTRLIFLSHITSPTAQLLPVEAICQRARQAGILTLIDGAHAPGQLPLQLEASGADFYTGNAHKWLLSPKGAAFLYARRAVQPLIQPLVVSWGYSADEQTTTGSRFVDLLQWTGTYDPSAALSVPAALEFIQAHAWPSRGRACNALLRQALRRLQDLTGLPGAYGERATSCALPPQLAVARLPAAADLIRLKAGLYDEFRVEVPLIEWNGQKFIRLSLQAYNDQADVDQLLAGLEFLLKEQRIF